MEKKTNTAKSPAMGKKMSHLQLLGMAMFDQVEDERFVKFEPDVVTPGLMAPQKRRALIVQASDGTFEVTMKPSYHSRAKQIVKLPHGRLSETQDGAYQLTLKVFKDEGVNAAKCFKQEALEAVVELLRYQIGL